MSHPSCPPPRQEDKGLCADSQKSFVSTAASEDCQGAWPYPESVQGQGTSTFRYVWPLPLTSTLI